MSGAHVLRGYAVVVDGERGALSIPTEWVRVGAADSG
jgi:hypothetical protein